MMPATPGVRNDDDVWYVQTALKGLGFNVAVSGSYEPRTSAAVLEFRDTYGLPRVDIIDDDFRTALDDATNRAADPGASGTGGRGRKGDVEIEGRTGGFPWGWALLAYGVGVAWWKTRR